MNMKMVDKMRGNASAHTNSERSRTSMRKVPKNTVPMVPP